MDRKIRDLLYSFFDKGYFHYYSIGKHKGIPFNLKKELYCAYLELVFYSEKLTLLSNIGEDNIILNIEKSLENAVRYYTPERFSVLGQSLVEGLGQVLDDILQDYFNEALEDWNNLYREDNLRYPTERDLDMASYNRERL